MQDQWYRSVSSVLSSLLTFLEILSGAASQYGSDEAKSFHLARECYCIHGEFPPADEPEDMPPDLTLT